MILAIPLLVSALKHLGRALAPIGELIRMALSALMVTVLLLGAIAVLVGVAVVGGDGPTVFDRVLGYGDAWFPTWNDHDLLPRIAELRERADRPVAVQVLGVPPDPKALEQLEQAGVQRASAWLPSAPWSTVARRLEKWEQAIAELTGDVIHSAVDGKPKRHRALRRLATIAHEPRVSLLADHDEDWSALWWVRADGVARVRDAYPAGLAALTAKYPQYAAAPPAGPFLEITVHRWVAWSAS